MTAQQIGNEALAIYQANRDEPRAVVESLLDQFFNFLSAADYEFQLRLVAEEMSCVSMNSITTSPSSSQLSAASVFGV